MAGLRALARLALTDPSRARALASTLAVVARLRVRGWTSRRRVVGDAPIDVCLTSYGPRIGSVHVAIESIARGSVRPRRLILWLDDEDAVAHLPGSLRRLTRRGLEVLPCPDLGPHKKQYPYALDHADGVTPMATADDDVLYPRTWLAGLVAAHRSDPTTVQGYRAHVVRVVGDAIAPYGTWAESTSDEPSFATFCTGVSGIVYPPEFLALLRSAGRQFLEDAPRADDVWVHAVAVRAGVRSRQVGRQGGDFPTLPGTQKRSLAAVNVAGGGNDEWISRCYDDEAIGRIRADQDRATHGAGRSR